MDDRLTHAYETPEVVDYGDLQELTAACLGATGADGTFPSSAPEFGASNPAHPGCSNGKPKG
jgi:hypothetical protein